MEFSFILDLIEDAEPDYYLDITISYTNEAGDSRSASTSTLVETAPASTMPENILIRLESSGSQEVIVTAEATTKEGESAAASTTVTVLIASFGKPDAHGNPVPSVTGRIIVASRRSVAKTPFAARIKESIGKITQRPCHRSGNSVQY